MKLLVCRKCGDIFNLSDKAKTCSCGESSGRYVDDLNAEIKGDCKAIGFSNGSLESAYRLQLKIDEAQGNKETCCLGERFEAFFIPESAKTVKRIQ